MGMIEKPCPACGGRLVVKKNRREGTQFIGCSNFPNCHYTERLTPSVEHRLSGAPTLPGLE